MSKRQSEMTEVDIANLKEKNPPVTPIRWAGQKTALYKHLQPYINQFPTHRFVEVFAGSGYTSFKHNPKEVLLNDINWALINFFHELKRTRC